MRHRMKLRTRCGCTKIMRGLMTTLPTTKRNSMFEMPLLDLVNALPPMNEESDKKAALSTYENRLFEFRGEVEEEFHCCFWIFEEVKR